MKRRSIHKYPVVLRDEIFAFLQNTPFKKLQASNAFDTPFFQQFKDRYNGVPIFSRFSCDDVHTFKKCIHWFGLDAILKSDHKEQEFSKYDYQYYAINPVIFSLLQNESLKTIADIDGDYSRYFTACDSENNDVTKFGRNTFEEINPFGLDGELAELALQGSVYMRWEMSTIDTKSLANDFVIAITEGRYNDFKVYKTTEPWGGYILGFFVAYFIFDEGKGEFWILSKDDYD
jgi:hypothetical protein